MIDSSPSVYQCPSAGLAEGHTTYLAIVDPESCFSGSESVSLSDITDGSSNTLLVLETAPQDSVPWMSPHDASRQYFVDIQQDSETAHSGGTQATLCDGSVQYVSDTIEESVRIGLVTIAGGEHVAEF